MQRNLKEVCLYSCTLDEVRFQRHLNLELLQTDTQRKMN